MTGDIEKHADGAAQPGSAFRVVEAIEWLTLLKADATRVEVHLGGLPARLSPPGTWRAGPISLGEHLLLGVVGGEVAGWVEGEPFAAAPGTLAWICPGARFDMRASGRARPELVRVRLAVRSGEEGLTFPWRFWVGEAGDRAIGYLEHLAGYDEDLGPDLFGDVRVRSLVALLSLEVFGRELGCGAAGRQLSAVQRERLRRAALLPDLHLGGVREIARFVGLAPDYFRKVFHATYGMSPKRWLMEERVRQAARRLLESEMTVGEIARGVGYRSGTDLARAFGAVYGCSPARFRKRPPKGF